MLPDTDDDHDSVAVLAGFQATLSSFAFNSVSRSRTIDSRSAVGTSPGTLGKRISSERNDSDIPTTPKKRKRGYAAPETYAHLRDLQDILKEGLDVVFCGINPGQKSAEIGHHFGHPTNHFWGCLHESGLTSERLAPQDDHTLPDCYSLGLTNLVDRATAEQNELSAEEQQAGVPVLLNKITRYRPRIVCFIGLGIARTFQMQLRFREVTHSFPLSAGDLHASLTSYWQKKKGIKLERSKEGLQSYKLVYKVPDAKSKQESEDIPETLFYAIPSTSGRVVHPQRSRKVELFSELRSLLEQVKQSKLGTEDMDIIESPGEE